MRALGFVSIVTVVVACRGPGQIVPNPQPDPVSTMPSEPMPSQGQVVSELKLEEVPYLDDDTYASEPALLIGKVAEIRKAPGTDCPLEKPRGVGLFVGKIIGLKITPAVKPELRK